MGRRIMQCASLLAVVGGLGVVGAGCLDRPVVTAEPLTKNQIVTLKTWIGYASVLSHRARGRGGIWAFCLQCLRRSA